MWRMSWNWRKTRLASWSNGTMCNISLSLPIPIGVSGPSSNAVFFIPPGVYPTQDLDSFSRFCSALARGDRQTCSYKIITRNRSHQLHSMRPKRRHYIMIIVDFRQFIKDILMAVVIAVTCG